VRKWNHEPGFSLVELLFVVGIVGLISAMVVPSTARTVGDLRLRGDARAIHNMVALAKMRAAARSTRERFYVDLTSETFFMQYWDKGTSTWVNESGSTGLSSGVDFGFAALGEPPADTQSTIGQSPECTDDDGDPIEDTACVTFNSRGVPVDSVGAPTGNTGFYITDGTAVYGITLSATPLIRLWWSPAESVAWIRR
jgi:prepilin-type N-terminal cleavage/methylation domain-containing protein